MDLKVRARSFQALAALERSSILLPDQGQGPQLVTAAMVSPEFFDVLRVSPALGRTFLPEEHLDGSEAVLLLTYGAWQRRFAGDPDVVGRSLSRVGAPVTIIGVLPADFALPETVMSRMPDFFVPLQPDRDRYASRGMRSLYIFGRLAVGTTVEQARVETTQIADELAREFPDGNVYPDGSHFGIGVNGLLEQTVGTTGRALWIFMGASGLVLMLAALNAATLLLARALDRVRELGVRVALGASRARVMRLLLVEAGILSVAGGAIGVALAYGGVQAFLRWAPNSIPRTSMVAVDAPVLAVAAAISVAAGLAAGLLPALRVTSCTPWRRLQGAGRSVDQPGSRLRSALVGGQVALAVLLLSGAGPLLNSFMKIRSVEPGFNPEGLLSLSIGLKRPGAPEREEMWQAWDLALPKSVPYPACRPSLVHRIRRSRILFGCPGSCFRAIRPRCGERTSLATRSAPATWRRWALDYCRGVALSFRMARTPSWWLS
jgi:predicted permease